MKLIVAGLVGMLALSGVAHAQPAADESKGYIEFVAQSAFGNVTSQSFGAEGGYRVASHVSVFGEFGMTANTAPASIGQSAQIIANAMGAGAGYSVKQPVQFGIAGIRYTIPHGKKLQPYVLAGAGLASVKRDVTFTVGGTDVTDKLSTYGVVLGSDLSGTESKAMLSVGGGVVWKPTSAFILDFGYRYGHIMTETTGTNLNRIGAGIGFTF